MAPTIELLNLGNPGQPPVRGESCRLIVHNPPNGKRDCVIAVYSGQWEHVVTGGPGYVDQFQKQDDDDPGPDWGFDFVLGTVSDPAHGTDVGGAWLESPSQMYAYVLDGTDFSKPPLAMFSTSVNP